MLVVRSLADEQGWQQLAMICQAYPGDYRNSASSDEQLEFPLDHSIAIEAARLLAESGAISVASIRQKLVNGTVLWPAPPKGKLPKTLPLNWRRNDEPLE